MRLSALATTTAIAIALTATLAGCTASPPEPSEPSADDTCMQIQSAIDGAYADFTAATAVILDDPAGAAETMTRGAVRFTDTAGVIENRELRDVAEPIGDAMNRYAEAATAYSTDASEENAGALNDSIEEIEEHFAAVAEICE